MSAHIVVADDEQDIRQLIVFTLTRRGYQVTEAARGDTALDAVRTHRPDIVVLDAMMPGMTGLEVARALSDDPQTADIPILMVSAKGQEAEIKAGLDSGVQGYMVKPFSPRELGEQVAKMLEARQ
jgi:DNA-binding response OmpR family regulator